MEKSNLPREKNIWKEPQKKKVLDYFPLMYLGTVDADEQIIEIEQNVDGLNEVFRE